MMLTRLLPTLLLFWSVLCSAQEFDITYPNQQSPYVWAQLAQTPDGGFVAASAGDFTFIKTDAQGQMQWGFNPPLAGSDPTDGGGVLTYSDGTIILGGEQQQNLGYLTKVDASGQVIWDNLVLEGDVQALSPGINGYFWAMVGCCSGTLRVVSYSASGGHYWSRYYHKIQAIRGTQDGGVVTGGIISHTPHIRKYDADGNELWSYDGSPGPNNNGNQILSIVEGADGRIYAAGSNSENGFQAFLVILNADGSLVNEMTFPFGSYFQSIEHSNDGNFIVSGASNGRGFTAKIQADGTVIWERIIDGYRTHHAIPTTNGGTASLVRAGNGGTRIVKTDDQGNVFNSFISGTILTDNNDDCIVQSSDLPTETIVSAKDQNNGNTFFARSNSNGEYKIDLPPSTYEIKTSISSNYEPCEQTIVAYVLNIQNWNIGSKLYRFNPNPTGTITGQVYIDNNSNCEFDAGDTPLECVRVPLTQEGQIDPIFYGETDENGEFIVEVIADWHYYLYGFSNNLWGSTPADGCFFTETFVPAYDTVQYNFPLSGLNLNTPAYISGQVYIDANNNCLRESNEIPTDNFEVGFVLENTTDTLCINPLQDGYYAAILEAGIYEVFIKLAGNPNWVPCDMSITVDADSTCMEAVDIGIKAEMPCTDFSVSIAASTFRICQESHISVLYQNIGTATGPATIQVVMDTLVSYLSSTLAPTMINGDTLTFVTPDLPALEFGYFYITGFTSCDAVMGETHCLEASVISDNPCDNFTQNWDGSSIIITGSCEGNVLNVNIENVGDQPMSEELEYIVIEDNILLYTTPFQLNAGQSIDFQIVPNGTTIQVEAEQSLNHPGRLMPARSFEGCGQNGTGSFSMGYVTQYSQNDADPDVSIFCLENINTFDPNDKLGLPRGITEHNFIQSSTQLEYMIRFQNTGTAPANEVVLTDELSTFLNQFSLTLGASSHPYNYELVNGSVATFTFPNINLPDSSANFEASQGFVTFTIDQYPNNAPGTIITNEANIYFDNNDPVLTNQTFHQIPLPLYEQTTNLEACAGSIFNGTTLNQDTSIIETTSYAFFDSLLHFELAVHENYYVELDTAIQLGQSYNGIVYEVPITLIDSFTTMQGCDSIHVTHLDILLDTSTPTSFGALQVLPNPTTGQLHLYLNSNTDVQLTLYDPLGKIIDLAFQHITSNHSTIDLSELVGGIYFLHAKGITGEETLKIVKH